MTSQSWLRLLGVILTGILVFGMVIGSIGFTQLDPMLAVQRPTQVILLPSRTLFPTQIPESDTPVPDTSTPTPTETVVEEATKTTVPTLTTTSTPSSPLVVQCEYPEGWLPYTVKISDNIYTLAVRANTSSRLLLQANCIGTTEDIKSGTVLYLPPIAFSTPTRVPYICGPPATWRIVIVNPNETLYGLAVRYGTTIDMLRKANCMNNYILYAGQALFVPPYIVVPPTATPIPWPTPTVTPMLPTPTFTATPGITPTSTLLPTATPTLLPTTPSATITPMVTMTPEPSMTPTYTPVLPTATPTQTLTPSPTATSTQADFPSLTPTPTLTPIPSLTPTSTSPVTTTVN